MLNRHLHGHSRSNLARITLVSNFEGAGIFPPCFPDIVNLTGSLAFVIAATLPVIPVAYFDIHAIVGASLQVDSLDCN